MLGIPETIGKEVAMMPTPHSWLAEYLKLEGEERDRKESEIAAWIDRTAEKMWPEAERAGRIAREAAGLFLERKALMAWQELHPVRGRMLAIPNTIVGGVPAKVIKKIQV